MARGNFRNIEEEDESYYMSMTDLMVGVLLIFILLMIYYALQMKLEADIPKSVHQEVIDERDNLRQENRRLRKYISIYAKINKKIVKSKIEILNNLKNALSEKGFDEVEINNQYGVLSMPVDLLFRSGRSTFDPNNPRINIALEALADAIFKYSLYYTKNEYIENDQSFCETEFICIDNIYIEGHADNDPVKYVSEPGIDDNLRLSARRSTNTFRTLINVNDRLPGLLNLDGLAVLSASAHGNTRPRINNEVTDQDKQANRRIDIRIIMYSPSIENIRTLEGFDNLPLEFN